MYIQYIKLTPNLIKQVYSQSAMSIIGALGVLLVITACGGGNGNGNGSGVLSNELIERPVDNVYTGRKKAAELSSTNTLGIS